MNLPCSRWLFKRGIDMAKAKRKEAKKHVTYTRFGDHPRTSMNLFFVRYRTRIQLLIFSFFIPFFLFKLFYACGNLGYVRSNLGDRTN